MKERYFWIGMIVVICSMAGNYLYSQSKQLAEPIFLQHYYETVVYEGSQLHFYYLSNKADPVEVSHVTVDDTTMYPVENVHAFSMWGNEFNRPEIIQEFTHHQLQSVTLELPTELPVAEGYDDVWAFKDLQVTFRNGQTINANIGEVRVHEKLPYFDGLNNTYASASNQNTSQWFAAATEPITIEGISTPFSKEVGSDIYIKLMLGPSITTQEDLNTYTDVPDWFNEEFTARLQADELEGVSLHVDLFPIHLEESDFIKLFKYFNPETTYAFDFSIWLYGSTKEGEPFEYALPINSNSVPSLTEKDVQSMIDESMGGLDD